METLWGTVEPVPEDRMTILTDEDRIAVGNRTLVGLHTPGHAMHHVAFHDVDRETVFTGDVAAVRLQGIRFVQPATPPPEVDLELWDRSLDRLRGLRPCALYLTHFGPSRDVEWHLREAHEHLHEWGDLIRRAMESGQDRGAIVDTVRLFAESELLKVTDQPAATFRYDLAAGTGMSVDGYVRYFTKRAEAASPAS
ncbi:MAG: MBL fold metallo-hydrolase [Chloroflexi bacterium]|nr:MBL fold metallo-hydrolase [Chloroflexota bacterium]